MSAKAEAKADSDSQFADVLEAEAKGFDAVSPSARPREPDVVPNAVNPRIFCFYAEKGGVGKSTYASTFAAMLACRTINPHRVLLVDCDSQRNATSFLLGQEINEYKEQEQDGNLYDLFLNDPDKFDNESRNLPKTLYDQLMEVYNTEELRPVAARHVKRFGTLWIVPGHRQLSDFDGHIASAESTIDQFPASKHLPGAPYHAVLQTAARVRADIVVLDLNPNSGALNRSLVMSSHVLIVPAVADFFSYEMMIGLIERLKEWRTKVVDTLIPKITAASERRPSKHPFPTHLPKFLGYVLSRYSPLRKGDQFNGIATDRPPYNENHWLLRVHHAAGRLIEALRPIGMAFPAVVYARAHRFRVLGLIRDFHQLGDISGIVHTPVPLLTAENMVSVKEGVQTKHSSASSLAKTASEFHTIFTDSIDNVFRLLANADAQGDDAETHHIRQVAVPQRVPQIVHAAAAAAPFPVVIPAAAVPAVPLVEAVGNGNPHLAPMQLDDHAARRRPREDVGIPERDHQRPRFT